MSTLKIIQKDIGKLEAELGRLRAAESALQGLASGASSKGKPAKAAKAKTKAVKAAKTKAKAAAPDRQKKRAVTQEHLETVFNAIGERLPALELKGKIDGRVLRALPLKAAIAKLRKDGVITTEGVKRQMVYVRALPAVKPPEVRTPKARTTTAAPVEAATNGAQAEA